ncbi:MAG TPA: molybdate ABC transporter permease subunit [Accumulibacter sp.]|nr:molybdate ABC transporter permease subunit [Accumulibacter sp.]
MLTASDLDAVWLTVRLASVSSVLLLLFGTPLAWWLARSRHWGSSLLASLVTLPLILPPTVLGFYLLLLMGPDGALGQALNALGVSPLPFTFSGLVVASMVYSLPFVVQPLQQAFAAIGDAPLEAAATLRAGPWDSFFSVVIPLAAPGFFNAAVLGFAHTVGEFGVVLMIGGNIPGKTQVLSMALYNHVEALDYAAAHRLAAGMLLFSFAVLLLLNRYRRQHAGE